MSCLNLKRLLPNRKLWKVLTSKLSLKLIRSKVNKKQTHKTSKKLSFPSLSIQPKKFKKHTVIHHKNHRCYSRRRPPPSSSTTSSCNLFLLVREHVVSPSNQKLASTSSSSNKSENLDPKSSNHDSGQPRSGKEETIANADDVWESMLLNSPQMDGIDERADTFIARFRAEMRRFLSGVYSPQLHVRFVIVTSNKRKTNQ